MSKSLSIKLPDRDYNAIMAKCDELPTTPPELIRDALEAYGVLAPDEGFNLKLRAHLRDILGFSSPEGLEAFVLSCLQHVSPSEVQNQPKKPTRTRRPNLGSNPEIAEKISAMSREGRKLREISEATGYPISTVHDHLKRTKEN